MLALLVRIPVSCLAKLLVQITHGTKLKTTVLHNKRAAFFSHYGATTCSMQRASTLARGIGHCCRAWIVCLVEHLV